MDSSFASLVRHLRQTIWLTQEELAEKSGLSPRTIQALEGGHVRRPHRESIRLLADALGLHGGARAEFVAAAHQGTRGDPGGRCACGVRPCPSPADIVGCLARHLRHAGEGGQRVDLSGLGATADPATVLTRLLRALGIEDGD